MSDGIDKDTTTIYIVKKGDISGSNEILEPAYRDEDEAKKRALQEVQVFNSDAEESNKLGFNYLKLKQGHARTTDVVLVFESRHNYISVFKLELK